MKGAPCKALAGASLALLVVSGCSLVLDFSDLPDGGPSSDAGDSCEAFEPNDDRDSAMMLDVSASAAICLADPSDLDFFQFTTAGGEDVTIRLEMPDGSGPGNLNLRLYADGVINPIDETNTATNEDVIERTSALGNQLAAGDYDIEVFGVAPGNSNQYTLSVTTTTP